MGVCEFGYFQVVLYHAFIRRPRTFRKKGTLAQTLSAVGRRQMPAVGRVPGWNRKRLTDETVCFYDFVVFVKRKQVHLITEKRAILASPFVP
jgi:hypothetical protein